MTGRIVHWILLLPVQIALALLGLSVEILRGFTLPQRSRTAAGPPLQDPVCSIVVLNWNGRTLLEETLPPLLEEVRRSGRDHEVLVVDNGSDDDSLSWLARHFPEVGVLALPSNLGFAEGNNRGVAAARHPIVILLNNDMIIHPGFLRPLLEGFADPRVFAVSSQIHFPAGKRREETGNTRARVRRGRLGLAHLPIEEYHLRRSCLPVWWAGGGSSAFRRERFLELGGFSALYSPCYLEDTDLSYRAWRRGWHCVLAARSEVTHKHRSSSRQRFQQRQLEVLVAERRLWYLWQNFPLHILLPHLLLYPLHAQEELGVGNYWRSLRRLPRVLWERFRQPGRTVSHRQLRRWVNDPLAYLNDFQPDRSERSRVPGGRLRLLVLSAYLPHLGKHGGAGRVFQLLSRVAQQTDVTLVSFVETPEEQEEVAQVQPFCRRIETVFRKRFEPLSLYPYEPFEEFHCASFRERLRELLLEEDFDAVHYEWTQMALYSDLLPPWPSLLTEIEVNYAAHYSLVPVERHLLRKVHLYYRTLQTLYRELEMCRRVGQVVCVTDADRDFLAGYLEPSQLKVINTGVDTGYFTPGEEALIEPDALVYVGAFRHDPNVDAMRFFCREIFPLIRRERPQTRLYIVGSSPPREIQRLGEHPGITVTGFVRDIRDYYWRAQVVVVPLRTGVGIRGKILEGWAAGKAMVATSQACLGIRAQHGENILIADRPEPFARWTLALLRHPEHCRRLGLAGRETARRYYEWDALAGELSRTYLETLEPGGSPEREQREKEEVLS